MDIGIQLYSVRDAMEKSVDDTLAALAEMGYTSVQFAGYYGHTAEEILAMLKKYNLKIAAVHTSINELLNDFEGTMAYHKALGIDEFIIPSAPLSCQEEIDFFVEKVNEFQPKMEKEGIILSFHNHAREFEMNKDGSVAMEQIICRTNIRLEIDTYWAFTGMKQDPCLLLERLKDRIRYVHIKDGTLEKRGYPLGMGEAPLTDILNKCIELGFELVVESETCNPSGLEEAKICIEYLKNVL